MVVSDKESNRGDRIGRCAMISVVDEEIMKSEDGQELVVPPTGEDHETYEQVHISRELTKEQLKCFLTFDFHITCFVCFVHILHSSFYSPIPFLKLYPLIICYMTMGIDITAHRMSIGMFYARAYSSLLKRYSIFFSVLASLTSLV